MTTLRWGRYLAVVLAGAGRGTIVLQATDFVCTSGIPHLDLQVSNLVQKLTEFEAEQGLQTCTTCYSRA
jgi:hypothetical protein